MPVPEDGDLAKQIDSAKLGIIFHTTYAGDSLATMNAQGGADVSSFAQSPDVFFDNAIIQGRVRQCQVHSTMSHNSSTTA